MAHHDHDHDHDHAPEPAPRAGRARAAPRAPHRRHHHGPGAHTTAAAGSALFAALVLTAAFLIVEAIAGILTHSLALLSDAGHMLADVGALALALAAQRIAARPRSSRWTYGLRRAEVLAALANAVLLGVTAVWVLVEAARRWSTPPAVHGGGMLATATAGLAVNLLSAWLLARGGGHAHDSNTRAALAHVAADAAGSVAAMLAAAGVLLLGWRRADTVASVAVAVLIGWGAWRLIAQALGVLLEGAPPGLDMDAVETTLRETPGVASVHDLHAWLVAEGFVVVTAHLVLDGTRHGPEATRAASTRLAREFGIEHVTLQAEAPGEGAGAFVPATALVRASQP